MNVEEFPQEIGGEIRRRRKRQRLSQTDLALVANVTLRTVHAIERGKPTVQLDVLLRVLDAVGLELVPVTRAEARKLRATHDRDAPNRLPR